MRKISASNSTSGEKSVSREKFLKKCHVEHKRIGGVARDGDRLKFDSIDFDQFFYGFFTVFLMTWGKLWLTWRHSQLDPRPTWRLRELQSEFNDGLSQSQRLTEEMRDG